MTYYQLPPWDGAKGFYATFYADQKTILSCEVVWTCKQIIIPCERDPPFITSRQGFTATRITNDSGYPAVIKVTLLTYDWRGLGPTFALWVGGVEYKS